MFKLSFCNGVCMFAGAGAVVVWWHDRHRAAGFTATVWRPKQRDGRLRCVTEPEDQVAHGSNTALQTQTIPSIHLGLSQHSALASRGHHLPNERYFISLSGPTANNIPWQANIYTHFWCRMKRHFLRKTQEFTILEYIYQEKRTEKQQDKLFFWTTVKTLWTFFFCSDYAGSLFRDVIGSSNNCDLFFLVLSYQTKCLLTVVFMRTQLSFCMLHIYNSKPLNKHLL